jgi:hypothetical protein
MTEFKFFCPHCGRQIQCDTSYLGTQINCPVCQQSITVPQSAPAVPPPVAVPSHTLRNVLAVVVALLVLAGLVIGGWYGYSKIKIRKSPPGLVGLWLDGNTGVFKNTGQSGVIMVANSASLVSMQQTRQLTYSVWIKPNVLAPVFPVLLSKGGNQPGGAYGGYEFQLNANGDNDLVFASGGCEFITRNANGRWINKHLGEWIHVAFTIDDRTKVAQFYVNGQPTNDAFNEGTSDDLNFDLPDNLYIGAPDPACTANRSRFDGEMRDVMLFNRALSASEIQAIFSEQKTLN